MKEASTYQAVSIGDIAEWRLICQISDSGMDAFLKNSNPEANIVTLFREEWIPDETTLLNRIESAVYDHPQVLDDFSADIVICAQKTLLMPKAEIDDDEETAENLFRRIYNVRDNELMLSGAQEGAVAAFVLVPGLKSFLQRTFPGSNVHSHLGLMASRLNPGPTGGISIILNISGDNADIVVFNGTTVLVAVSRKWKAEEDLVYHLLNILDIYGLDPKETAMSVNGNPEVKNPLMALMRPMVGMITTMNLPAAAKDANMPVPAALLVRNKQMNP